MQAKVTYLLTEQAQRAHMLSTGRPIARKQEVVEDVPNDLLSSKFCRIGQDGSIAFDLEDNAGIVAYVSTEFGRERVGTAFDCAPRSAEAAIREMEERIRAQQAAADARKEQRRIEQAEDRAKEAKQKEAERAKEQLVIDAFLADSSKLADERGEYYAKIDGVRIEDQAVADEANRRYEAAEQAKDADKKAFLESWLAEHGTEADRRQYADGLLCRRELLTLVADKSFSDAGVPEEHATSEVCQHSDCPCTDHWTECLPREVYPVWQALKARLPQGTTWRFSEVRECLRSTPYREDEETAGPAYYTVDLTMPAGPYKFERKVSLGN